MSDRTPRPSRTPSPERTAPGAPRQSRRRAIPADPERAANVRRSLAADFAEAVYADLAEAIDPPRPRPPVHLVEQAMRLLAARAPRK